MTLDEFAAMRTAQTRPMMVDRFQAFDDDGDGRVTGAEMAAPAERMFRMIDRDGDGAIGPSDMRGPMGSGMRKGMASWMGQGRN